MNLGLCCDWLFLAWVLWFELFCAFFLVLSFMVCCYFGFGLFVYVLFCWFCIFGLCTLVVVIGLLGLLVWC